MAMPDHVNHELVGRRVKITGEMNDPNPIPLGETGTIVYVDDMVTMHVHWDNGRRLGLLCSDPFVLIPRTASSAPLPKRGNAHA